MTVQLAKAQASSNPTVASTLSVGLTTLLKWSRRGGSILPTHYVAE